MQNSSIAAYGKPVDCVNYRYILSSSSGILLLARLMGQYCFVRWRLSASSVTLQASSVNGRVADTARWASTVTSR